MKPKAPTVPLNVWRDLYSAAEQFQRLRPWETLDDTDLLGVHDPATGETGYGICMGNAGTLFGFCLYRGAEGFDLYVRTLTGALGPDQDDFFALQNCTMLELGARQSLQPEDLALVRQLGLSFRGKHSWPSFRSYLPGYFPWFLTETEAQFLTLALHTVCHHSERVRNGEANETIRNHECLVYSPITGRSGAFAASWEPWPSLAPPPIPLPVIDFKHIDTILAKKPKPDSPWEADVFYLPSTIGDVDRPYYMRVTAVCQQSSGFVFVMHLERPETKSAQALADTLCSSVEQHGFLPDTVYVRRAEYAAALAPLAKTLGLTIRQRKQLKAIEHLRRDLRERFAYGRGGR